MRRVAIAAAKGGTGKTTTAVTLAHALALAGWRVLLVDCDPRRHAALHFGLPAEPGLAAWLQGQPARAVEVREGLRVLDSGGEALAALETEWAATPHARLRLRRALEAEHDADFVLLDCGPGSGALQEAVLLACDEIVLPVGMDYLALASAGAWLAALDARRDRPGPRLLGLLATFFDACQPSSLQVERVLEEQYAGRTLQTRISSSDALRAAPAQRGTVFDSEPLSRGALEYALLAEEIAARFVATP